MVRGEGGVGGMVEVVACGSLVVVCGMLSRVLI